jgi:LemA protein
MYELSGTENRIAVARMRYNESVQSYNVYIRVFPNSIVAGMKGVSPKQMFEAAEGAERAPEVKF